MNHRFAQLHFLLLLPLVVSCTGEPPPSVVTFGGRTMGTTYTVRLARGGHFREWPPKVEAVQQRVDQRLAEINSLMSTYDPDSELSRFNRLNSTDWFAVSPELVEVVAAALEVSERTLGAFDPTVGPVVELWGFGPQKGITKPPGDEKIAAAMARIGFKNVRVRSDPPAIRKELADVYLDLSGIAKGYAADSVSRLLAEIGYRNSMVEIGGEVTTRGRKVDGAAWLIGVEKPQSFGDEMQAAIPLNDAGMATSGDYRNFFEHDGVRYSHTIDPATGRPVEHQLAAVSIVAANCMEADALATAVLVMGQRRGYDWCAEQGVAALLLVREGDAINELSTPEFQKLLKSE